MCLVFYSPDDIIRRICPSYLSTKSIIKVVFHRSQAYGMPSQCFHLSFVLIKRKSKDSVFLQGSSFSLYISTSNAHTFFFINISVFNPLLHMCAASVDPGQPIHLCHLIWIFTGCFLAKNNLITDAKSKIADSDVPEDLDLHCLPIG
jgi:hypothetical protein